MDTLPIEVLEKISQHLTAAELAACGAVCRQWRELFNDDSLWKPRCDEALEETLRTTPCVAEPPFVSPEEPGSGLSPIGEWRLAYMRENHLWNNWRQGRNKVASFPVGKLCHTYFISNNLVVRVFDDINRYDGEGGAYNGIELYYIKEFPPTLLKEITSDDHGGWVQGCYYVNDKLMVLYQEYCLVYNLNLNAESILDFKFKICLKQIFNDGIFRTPRYAIMGTVILGYNPMRFSTAETFHVWDLEEGTELKVEKSPEAKPYGFTDVITSKTSDNAIIVVSNYRYDKLSHLNFFEPRKEVVMITYHFHVYNTKELKYSPSVKVFKAELKNSALCATERYKTHGDYLAVAHRDYLAIAIDGVLTIYNYRSLTVLTEVPVKTITQVGRQPNFLDVIDDCFAFIVDDTFKMFHPTSRTFTALVDLQVSAFTTITNNMVKMVRKEAPTEIWRVRRNCQQRLSGNHISEGKIHCSSTRALEDVSSEFKKWCSQSRRTLSLQYTKWFYYW